jgi:hypothetical protein
MTRTFRMAILSLALLAGACGTVMEGQTQEVTLYTPGASESKCTLDNGNRYTAVNGETVNVMRSNKDMIVECYAAGNRYKKVIVPSGLNKWAAGDVGTGVVPGVAIDHLYGGLYAYNSPIMVDFGNVPTHGFETPDYHNKDAPNPYNQPIESYAASTPKASGDANSMKRGVQKTRSVAELKSF